MPYRSSPSCQPIRRRLSYWTVTRQSNRKWFDDIRARLSPVISQCGFRDARGRPVARFEVNGNYRLQRHQKCLSTPVQLILASARDSRHRMRSSTSCDLLSPDLRDGAPCWSCRRALRVGHSAPLGMSSGVALRDTHGDSRPPDDGG